jgi:hypothetical protein
MPPLLADFQVSELPLRGVLSLTQCPLRRLALLGACSAAEYDKMQGMMEFNVVLLRQGILDMLNASQSYEV